MPLLNEVPEHMAQEFAVRRAQPVRRTRSSMKFLSTWLRNLLDLRVDARDRGRSSMKFLSTWLRNRRSAAMCGVHRRVLNEVPEHMAQESARFSTRRARTHTVLNEVPEHMAQEFAVTLAGDETILSSMKFLSTWLRNTIERGSRRHPC